MDAFLSYPVSTLLSPEQELEIDERTQKARENFCRGFVKGTSLSLLVYSLYSIGTSSAYASEHPKPATPVATEQIPIQSMSLNKTFSDMTKSCFRGGTGLVCLSAVRSGDYILGLSSAILVVIACIVF
jgi:hypothetical protein